MRICLRHIMRSRLLALLVVASTLLAGCFGDGEEIIVIEEFSIFESYEMVDLVAANDPRFFNSTELSSNETISY